MLSVTPEEALIDVLRRIAVTGLSPGEEVVLLVLQVIAHHSQFEVSVRIDETGNDCGVFKVLMVRLRKLCDQLRNCSHFKHQLSINRDRALGNRWRICWLYPGCGIDLCH